MFKEKISIWGEIIPLSTLSSGQIDYLNSLPVEKPNVNWIWNEMNFVWRNLELNNEIPLYLQQEKINLFYSHPIWLVNGIFTASDSDSVKHRSAIANEIRKFKLSRIADYGGGFGELALLISQRQPEVLITIVEKYPSELALNRIKSYPNISFKNDLYHNNFDLIILQDILEHLDDPIEVIYLVASHLRNGGYILCANCFHPVIDCHLPKTFHLRHTFPLIMRVIGFRQICKISDASHASLYYLVKINNIKLVRVFEFISKIIGPVINKLVELYYSIIKHNVH